MKFTTSWDDGYALDMHVAEMLERHGMTGTFYACPHMQDGQTMLRTEEIRILAGRHEVGAHTIHHPHLTTVSHETAKREIQESKEWVESVTGKPCALFCYPYGDANGAVRDLVAQAGFRGARTTTKFAFQGSDPFLLPTSVVLNPFPFRPVANRRFLQPLQGALPHLRRLGISVFSCRSWLAMAKAVFRSAYASRQPWFHLWGHSNDIERYRQWNELDAFLTFVEHHAGIEHVQNSALLL